MITLVLGHCLDSNFNCTFGFSSPQSHYPNSSFVTPQKNLHFAPFFWNFTKPHQVAYNALKQTQMIKDKRQKRDLHALDENGMVLCNSRDKEAAHRAEAEGIATED